MYSSLNAESRKVALRGALDNVNLSEGCKSWLIQNIDPFHDHQFQTASPPTPSLVDSAIQCRRVRVNITADGTGKLSIFVPPTPYHTVLDAVTGVDTVCAADYGGLMVAKGDNPYSVVAALDPVTDGPSRVVGMGWELINTTPEMYKSGSVLVYQCPWLPGTTGSAGLADLIVKDAGTSNSRSELQRVMQPAQILPTPYPSEAATTLPSSKQWDSKHGLYVVPRLATFDGPFTYGGARDIESLYTVGNTDTGVSIKSLRLPRYSPYAGENFYPPGGQPCIAQDAGYLDFRTSSGAKKTGITQAFGGVQLSGYTATGCHLTGLSAQSTFTVVLTYYLQILPGPKSSLVSLIRPTTPYDPRAYQIYTEVMQHLPIACYKDDNDFGDWFRKALRLIGRFAPVIGAAFGPAGAAIGRGIGAATSLIKDKKRK